MFHHAELVARWVPASMKNECDGIQAFLVCACSMLCSFSSWCILFPLGFSEISMMFIQKPDVV